MLLDEDPAALIASCSANFNIAPDRASISRITSDLNTLSRIRQTHVSQQQSALHRLNRQKQTLESQHSLAVNSRNPTEHAAEILRLDTEKFRIAKQASDLEIEGERLGGELDRLKGVLTEVEAQGDEGAVRPNGPEEDATILKLKVYRMLGIDIESDSSTGIYNKATIRNTTKGDVHIVNIDPKFSRYFYANYIWGTI